MPPTSQNNQLQELPYNELSRLNGLRTLNLHNNLISSEGEGDNRRLPLPARSQQPSPSPLGLWAALRQFPELPFAEQDGNGEMGGRGYCGFCGQGVGFLEEPLPVPGQEPWVAGSADSPVPHPMPGLGSPHLQPLSQACLTRPLSPSRSCSTSTWPTTR